MPCSLLVSKHTHRSPQSAQDRKSRNLFPDKDTFLAGRLINKLEWKGVKRIFEKKIMEVKSRNNLDPLDVERLTHTHYVADSGGRR